MENNYEKMSKNRYEMMDEKRKEMNIDFDENEGLPKLSIFQITVIYIATLTVFCAGASVLYIKFMRALANHTIGI